MRVFVVIATKEKAKIEAAIKSEDLKYHPVGNAAWLVAAPFTTRELSEKIGIRGGETGSGLVVLIESYSGRLPPDAWEWLKIYEAKSE